MKKNMTSILTVAILVAFFLVMAVALVACQTSTLQPTQAQPEATMPPADTSTIDGATLLDERCSVCHSTSRVTGATNTSEGWDAIVTEMIGKGAELSVEEKAVLVEYLAQNYGK